MGWQPGFVTRSRSAIGLRLASITSALLLVVTLVPGRTSAAPGDYPWVSLGGVITSAPDIAETPDGTAYFVARGTDGAVWMHILESDEAFGDGHWVTLGGQIIGGPTISNTMADEPAENSGRLDVFARGTDNALWTRSFNAATGLWTNWHSLGGFITSEPSAVAFGDPDSDELLVSVFARGADNALWYREFEGGGGWTGWSSLGGFLTSAPGAGGYPTAFFATIAARGGDGAAWYRYYDAEFREFSPWFFAGGSLTSAPAAENFCSAALWGRGNSLTIWHAITDPHTGWRNYGGISRSAPGSHDVFFFPFWLIGVRGADDALWITGDDIVFDEEHCGPAEASAAGRQSNRPPPVWVNTLRH